MPTDSRLIQPLISTQAISTLTHVVPTASNTRDGLPITERLPSRADSVSRYRQVVLTSAPLVIADVLAIAAAYLTATLCTYAFIGAHYYWGLWNNLFALCFCHVLVGHFLGLFPASGINPVRELRMQVSSIAAAFVMLVAMNGLVGEVTMNEVLTIVIAFPLTVAIAPPARFCTRKIFSKFHWWGEKVIVVGMGQQGRAVYRFLAQYPQRGLKPLGMVDDDSSEYWNLDNNEQFDFLGTINDLVSICRERQCHWVIAAVAGMDEKLVQQILTRGSLIPNLVVLNSTVSMSTMWSESCDAAGLAGIHIQDRLLFPFQRALKRLSDIVGSIILLLITSPLMLILAMAIKVRSKGPVFYKHHGRLGRAGKTFGAWKIRTMVTNADQVLQEHLQNNPEAQIEWNRDLKLRNDPRIIPGVGHFLRRTSLDELPQLWNVLKGEMSLVGPRPIVPQEIEKYREFYPLYELVRPGMTGVWQVSGRNNTSYEDRVRLDSYYVRNWSLWLDYFVLLRTVRTVLFREGSY